MSEKTRSEGNLWGAVISTAFSCSLFFFIIGSVTARDSAGTHNTQARIVQMISDNQVNGPETIFQDKKGLYISHIYDAMFKVGDVVNLKLATNNNVTAITSLSNSSKFICMDWC